MDVEELAGLHNRAKGAPLELLVDPLWDSNFHVRTMAGDTLRFRVMLEGEPLQNASLLVECAQGWASRFSTDASGISEVQLLRDYYPDTWSRFARNHREPMYVTQRSDSKNGASGRALPIHVLGS